MSEYYKPNRGAAWNYGGAQPNISQTETKDIFAPLQGLDEQTNLAKLEAIKATLSNLDNELKRYFGYSIALIPSFFVKSF